MDSSAPTIPAVSGSYSMYPIYAFIVTFCIVLKKDENKQKEAGFGHF